MGWANCGTDSKGRPIGYAHSATCDESGCERAIDRGLAHACGGMHGEDEHSCEGYFCSEHLGIIELDEKRTAVVCGACRSLWEAEHPEAREEGEDT